MSELSMREEFESHVRATWFIHSSTRQYDLGKALSWYKEEYLDWDTQRAWLAWQAAWNHRAAPEGWKLAMRVLQSELYHQLDDEEQAICNALIMANPHISVPKAISAAPTGKKG